jgi:hypothetical protein
MFSAIEAKTKRERLVILSETEEMHGTGSFLDDIRPAISGIVQTSLVPYCQGLLPGKYEVLVWQPYEIQTAMLRKYLHAMNRRLPNQGSGLGKNHGLW